MDFTTLIAAMDTTTLLAGITAAAAVKIGPNVTQWGYSKVISWFGKGGS